MAEPLSTIAAVVGLVEIAAVTSSHVVRLARKWRHVPSQIESLSQELLLSHQTTKDLEAFYRQLEAQAQRQQVPQPNYVSALWASMERAALVWTELESILRSVQGSGKQKHKRATWWIKSSRIADLQGQLQEIRLGIRDILDLHTAWVSI